MALEPEAAYYNLHDEQKGYTHVRVRSGYVPQAQEINELQSIQDTQRKNLGNLLFKSGSIQRGGTYAKSGVSLSLDETQIWFDGRVLTAAPKTLTLTNAGTELVGILVTESLITAEDDSTLREPDVDALNYGLEGANRTKLEAEWVRNNSAAVPVHTFKDGVQQVAVPSSRIDPVNEALARRTYAESGNYVVTGFEVGAVAGGTETFSYKIGNQQDSTRNGSLAFVRGNEIAKLVPDYVTVPKALTTLEAQETFTYQPSDPEDPTATELAFAFPSDRQPPKVDVTTTEVRAVFDVIMTVNGHNANGTDALTLSSGYSLLDVLRVYKDADINNISDPTTVYLKGTSQAGPGAWYRSGNSIKWDVSANAISAWSSAPYTAGQIVEHAGNYWQAKQASTNQTPTDPSVYWQVVSISEPSGGDSYYAYATISRVLSASEYTVELVNGVWQLNISSLATRPYSLNRIDDSSASSTVTIDYEFYLPRVDIVYVDGNGVVAAQQGTPAQAPIAPAIPGDVLALAQVTVIGGGGAETATVKPFVTKRLTMLELQDYARRVRQLELNVALKDLETQGLSKASNNLATLRSILTEGFAYTIDDIQLDSDEVSRLKFVASSTTPGCIDVANRQLTLPLIEAEAVSLTPVGATDGGNFALTLDETGYFYPDTYLDQQKRTNTLRVNQFDEYIAPPVLQINPTGGVAENDKVVIQTYDPASAAGVAQLYKADWKAYTEGLADSQKSFAQGQLYDYMKRSWLWVYGSGFPANTMVELRVDGRAPKLRLVHPDEDQTVFPFNGGTVPTTTIVKPDASAASTGTVNVNGTDYTLVYPESSVVRTSSLGEFGCAILIPEGLVTGAVAVSAVALDAAQQGAETAYTVHGVLKLEDNGAAAMYQLTELVDYTFKQVPPKITSMVVKANGVELTPTNGIYNYTASANITVEVSWDPGSADRAGLPREIILLVKGTGKSGLLKLASGSAGFNAVSGVATFSGGVLNTCATGLELAAVAANVRGSSEAFVRTVRYQDTVPGHLAVSLNQLIQPTNVGNNVFEFGFSTGVNVSVATATYTLPNGNVVVLTPLS